MVQASVLDPVVLAQYGCPVGYSRSPGSRQGRNEDHSESEHAMMQVRVARPARNLDAVVSFYGGLLGMPVLASFEDHDGYSGVVDRKSVV